MDDKKEKYAFWLRPSLVAEMEEIVDDADIRSKSEFVTQAIKFYIGYLRQDKNTNYLAPIIAQTVKEEVESLEINLSRMLFKLAVGQNFLAHLYASTMDVDEKYIKILYADAQDEVRETNGSVSVTDAFRSG